MSISSRSFLLLFLVVLQFFAPLVHAHAHQQNQHFGWHIPGLEAYGAASGSGAVSQAQTIDAAPEGCIVAIDDGIREQHTRPVEGACDEGGLALSAWILSAGAESDSVTEFPEPRLLPSPHRYLSLSPRAPPA